MTASRNRKRRRSPNKKSTPSPHTAATGADRIHIIHDAARSCKVLCETDIEGTAGNEKYTDRLRQRQPPAQRPFFRQGSEYGLAIERICQREGALLAALGKTEKAQDEINYLTKTDQFIYGYRLGVLMTMEVFRTSDELVTGGA